MGDETPFLAARIESSPSDQVWQNACPEIWVGSAPS